MGEFRLSTDLDAQLCERAAMVRRIALERALGYSRAIDLVLAGREDPAVVRQLRQRVAHGRRVMASLVCMALRGRFPTVMEGLPPGQYVLDYQDYAPLSAAESDVYRAQVRYYVEGVPEVDGACLTARLPDGEEVWSG